MLTTHFVCDSLPEHRDLPSGEPLVRRLASRS